MRIPTRLASGATSFNMTPMIDVVFLLIIFFLVSSHLAQREARMELPLPQADSGQQPEPGNPLVVNIDRQGALWFAGRAVTAGELRDRLLQHAQRQPSEAVAVRIRSDRSTTYRNVQPALAACAAAGVRQVDVSVYSRSKSR